VDIQSRRGTGEVGVGLEVGEQGPLEVAAAPGVVVQDGADRLPDEAVELVSPGLVDQQAVHAKLVGGGAVAVPVEGEEHVEAAGAAAR
jgi:hypothetical protein